MPANGTKDLEQILTVNNPTLWDITSPNLYTAKVSLEADGKLTDMDTAAFGLRTFEFTANDGFHLNADINAACCLIHAISYVFFEKLMAN